MQKFTFLEYAMKVWISEDFQYAFCIEEQNRLSNAQFVYMELECTGQITKSPWNKNDVVIATFENNDILTNFHSVTHL